MRLRVFATGSGSKCACDRRAINCTALVLVGALLAGCGKSAKERAAEFGAKCGEAGFTQAQCTFLWAMARRAANDANDANLLAAVALSSSAATAAMGRR